MDSTTVVSTKANLKKYINLGGKWRFVPVVKSNGKPQPRLVLIDGLPVASTAGTFYIEWRQDGKRIQRPVGTSPREALDAWRVQCGELLDPAVVPDATPATDGKITTAIEAFLREVKATKSAATYRAYGTDLEWFQANITKQYFGQVTRQDILRVFGVGRDDSLNQKSINRRILVGVMALRNAGAVIELKKGDWPRTTEKGVEVYEREELEQFFKACDPDERLLFQTFLCTGFRARELATLCWADVDFKRLTITVRPKPAYGFTPKSYEERSVSVPAALINTLKDHHKAHTSSTLVFPTRPHPKRPNYGGEAPDAHHLELCKEIAYRAKLNCGRCKTAKGACIKGPHCAEWYLHKWRHTFATNMIQSGVDIKTLQNLLGHKNIATTEKYLKGLRIADLQQKIENSSLAAMLA